MYANDFEKQYAYIPLVAVRKEFRNKGIAKELVTRAVAHVRDMEGKIRTLGIHTNNAVALRLYQGLGFTKLDEKDGRAYMEIKF